MPLPESTPWDVTALKKAPKFEWIRQEGDVQALLYAGEKYRGKPTRVFAYYASPRTLGQAVRGKVPGIVLVHGGGGTAFANWAQLWAKRGYAAIAMDLAGCGEGRKRLPDGGPGQSHADKFRPSTSRSRNMVVPRGGQRDPVDTHCCAVSPGWMAIASR